MGILLYYLSCYGLTMAIAQSLVMKPIREYVKKKNYLLGELISCMMCTGFWVMMLISFVIPNYVPIEYYLGINGFIGKLMNSFAGMTIITFVYILVLVLETHFKIDW